MKIMKRILLILVVIISVAACNTSDKKATTDGSVSLTNEEKQKAQTDSANFTTIQWLDSTTQNLGQLKKNEQVEIRYRFKNAGSKNLVIQDVTAGCGCTIPEKPERAFAPGEEGVIKAKFNGSGQGPIIKDITVLANTPQHMYILKFTGEIKE